MKAGSSTHDYIFGRLKFSARGNARLKSIPNTQWLGISRHGERVGGIARHDCELNGLFHDHIILIVDHIHVKLGLLVPRWM
jgi:hypothetical protein